MNGKKFLKLAASMLVGLLAQPAQAKFVVNYDQFNDKTTVKIVPEKNVFKQIAQAKSVKYRLCDKESEVFELTACEKSDLGNFYRFFVKK